MFPLRRESYTEGSSPKIKMERDHFYGIGVIHLCGSAQLEVNSVTRKHSDQNHGLVHFRANYPGDDPSVQDSLLKGNIWSSVHNPISY